MDGFDENSVSASAIPAELTRDEAHLVQVLQDRDGRYQSGFVELYLGAVFAASDASRPDRFAHAAHGMRELLEKLPLFYDGAPTKIQIADVASGARRLADEYQRAKQNSACFTSGSPAWMGQIDSHLHRLLDRVDVVSKEMDRFPTRRVIQQRFLRNLDPLRSQQPMPGEESQLDEWKRLDQFFKAIAHHQRATSMAEFDTHATSCTTMLLNLLRPSASAILDQLDAIIQETA
jgi:hypothetical protein